MRWMAESAFSSIKRTFGEHVSSVKWNSIVNELMLKASIYNLFMNKMTTWCNTSLIGYIQISYSTEQFLKLQHHTFLFCLWKKHHYWKTVQYIKDRSTEECFDDYFLPYKRKEKCKLKHMINWFSHFIYFHNKEISVKWTDLL